MEIEDLASSSDGAFVAGVFMSTVDVPGCFAMAVYFSGCGIKCKGCQNAAIQDRKRGKFVSLADLTVQCNDDLCEWVAFLGGEPVEQMAAVIHVSNRLSKKKVALYTGYLFEQIPPAILELPNLVLVKSGPFVQRLLLPDGYWPCTSNQRVHVRAGSASATAAGGPTSADGWSAFDPMSADSASRITALL